MLVKWLYRGRIIRLHESRERFDFCNNSNSPATQGRCTLAQIIAQIIYEQKRTLEENRADYLRDFLPDCPACNARLTDAQRLVDLYH